MGFGSSMRNNRNLMERMGVLNWNLTPLWGLFYPTPYSYIPTYSSR